MQQVLYIDILFWMNWIFDGVLLLITARVTHRKIRFMRIGLAAAAGAGIAVLCEGYGKGILVRTVCGILLPPVCMVPIAFAVRKGAEFLYDLVHLNLAAAVMGGFLHFLYENTGFGRFYQLWIRGTGWEAAAVWMLALSMIAAMFMVEAVHRYRELSRIRDLLCEVTLICDDNEISLMALWDSGNQLYDPDTREPVHLIGYEACCKLLSEKESGRIGMLLYGSQPEVSDAKPKAGVNSAETLHSLHLIPFRTVGNSAGVLPVIQITAIKAAGLEAWQSPWIGICRDGLSEQGMYQMLLHSAYKQRQTSCCGADNPY